MTHEAELSINQTQAQVTIVITQVPQVLMFVTRVTSVTRDMGT